MQVNYNGGVGCTNSEVIIIKQNGTWNLPSGAALVNDISENISAFTDASDMASIFFGSTGSFELNTDVGGYTDFIKIIQPRALPEIVPMNDVTTNMPITLQSTAVGGMNHDWVVYQTDPTSPVFSSSDAEPAPFQIPDAGAYIVRLRVFSNCCGWSVPVFSSFSVGQPLSVDAIVSNETCEGASDGQIELIVDGGTPPYSFFWIGSNETSQNLTNVNTGVYSVIVTDADGTPLASSITVFIDNVFQLQGSVSIGASPMTAGKVRIYVQQPNATYLLTDSTGILSGQYFFFDLPVFSSQFIIQAVPDPTVYPATVAAPTFYANEGFSHQWDQPDLTYGLTATCGIPQVRNIEIVQPESANEPLGSALLSGEVRWADGKMAADPIPLIDIVVERIPPANSIFAYTLTDDQGRYQFSNVPMIPEENQFYVIYVSIPGLPMNGTYNIVITSTDTIIENLDFVVDTIANQVFPVGPTGIVSEQVSQLGALLIHPNPMTDILQVNLMGEPQLPIDYRVLDAVGRIIKSGVLRELKTPILRENWPAGLYMLEVNGQDGSIMSQRFIAR